MRVPRPARSPLRRAALRLLLESRGGTAIEYGLILAIIVLGMLTALIGLADVTTGIWFDMDAKVRAATSR